MRVPALIQSGWWVAVAAVVVSALTAWFVIAPLSGTPVPVADSDFDIDRVTVPHDLVVRAMARDAVRALSEPSLMTPAEIDRRNEEERGKLLVSEDRVIGVTIAGESRAYPLRLMRWHEVVNDVVGGEQIAVTYSPLCDSTAVFSRIINGMEIELGVSGYLYNSNTLLYNRGLEPAQSPLWIQLTGQPVTEGESGAVSPLPLRVSALATWGEWRKNHPDTRVMAPQTDLKKLYKRDPYHSYFGSDLLHFPVRPLPPPEPLRLKDRLVIVTIDGHDYAVALQDLAAAAGTKKGEADLPDSDVATRVTFSLVPGTATVELESDPHRLEAVRHTFWFAWYSLGGIIPDRDQIPPPDRANSTSITSPGGA
jgi:hypothetical protein